jgi:hypothetical protein
MDGMPKTETDVRRFARFYLRWAASGPADVRRWGGMPGKEPSWLQVVIKIVLDWRFLMALAVLIRVLLNR